MRGLVIFVSQICIDGGAVKHEFESRGVIITVILEDLFCEGEDIDLFNNFKLCLLNSFAGAVVRSGREILLQVRLTRILFLIVSIDQKAIAGVIITRLYPEHKICNLYKINQLNFSKWDLFSV